MSQYMTPAEVSAEFARAREAAQELRQNMATIPHSITTKLSPVEAAYFTETFEAEIGTIFDKFASDLAEAEKQLIHPTESEQ